MSSTPVQIPRKPQFKIGEVCKLTDTQPYVLRFWESEFPSLAPQKTRSGQRVYRRKDIEMVLRIKQLLYDESYTIAGARKQLETADSGADTQPQLATTAPAAAAEEISVADERLQHVREELEAILTLLAPDGKNSG